MKKLIAMFLAICMMSALCACSAQESAITAEEDTEVATDSVYWLNFKPESDEDLRKVAGMYTEETGVPAKVVTAASGGGSSAGLGERSEKDGLRRNL